MARVLSLLAGIFGFLVPADGQTLVHNSVENVDDQNELVFHALYNSGVFSQEPGTYGIQYNSDRALELITDQNASQPVVEAMSSEQFTNYLKENASLKNLQDYIRDQNELTGYSFRG